MKKIYLTAITLASVLCAACGPSGQPVTSHDTPVATPAQTQVYPSSSAQPSEPVESPEATPSIDLGKSQSLINQDMTVDDWQQIVTDKDRFKLGELFQAEHDTYYDYGSLPKMDGSTVCVPMAIEFYRQYIDDLDESRLGEMAMFSTTSSAYHLLITKDMCYTAYKDPYNLDPNKPLDMLLATEPSDSDIKHAKLQGIELRTDPFCMDGFVFITHESNPVDGLTTQQIKDIYTGKITNWKDVGGEDMPILPFQRTPDSGSQTGMENLVMQGERMMEPSVDMVADEMSGLVEVVKEYENTPGALGYSYKYYLDNQYKSESVKMLAIDGVLPTAENIQSKVYPYFSYYNCVTRKGDEGNAADFIDWIQSEEGQRCVVQAGYIPLP